MDIFNHKKILELELEIDKLKALIEDIKERPNKKWDYKFIKVKSNPYIPQWYKCKYCGVEFQTSPPSGHMFGDMDAIYNLCPDCEFAVNKFREENKKKKNK